MKTLIFQSQLFAESLIVFWENFFQGLNIYLLIFLFFYDYTALLIHKDCVFMCFCACELFNIIYTGNPLKPIYKDSWFLGFYFFMVLDMIKLIAWLSLCMAMETCVLVWFDMSANCKVVFEDLACWIGCFINAFHEFSKHITC